MFKVLPKIGAVVALAICSLSIAAPEASANGYYARYRTSLSYASSQARHGAERAANAAAARAAASAAAQYQARAQLQAQRDLINRILALQSRQAGSYRR